MLGTRILGVLRQYPDPKVAFFTADVLLEGAYLPGIVTPGLSVDADLAEVLPDIPESERVGHYLQECVREGKWYNDKRFNMTKYDAITHWVAMLVSRYSKGKVPDARWDYLALLSRQVQTIADWVNAENPNLMALTLNQAVLRSRRWHAAFKRKNRIQSIPAATVLYKFADGWTMQSLTTREQLKAEADVQGICVGGDYYVSRVLAGTMRVWSLRDVTGTPRVTLEVDADDKVRQVKGKGNGLPKASGVCKKLAEAAAALGVDVYGASDFRYCVDKAPALVRTNPASGANVALAAAALVAAYFVYRQKRVA